MELGLLKDALAVEAAPKAKLVTAAGNKLRDSSSPLPIDGEPARCTREVGQRDPATGRAKRIGEYRGRDQRPRGAGPDRLPECHCALEPSGAGCP
jgi:hypothetical protein